MSLEKDMGRGHGGNIYKYSRIHNIDPIEVTDFSANINPAFKSVNAIEAIIRHMHEINHYPDPDSVDLKETLSAYLRIPKEYLLLGNGAAELLLQAVKVENVNGVVILSPSFSEYKESAEKANLPITEIPYIQVDKGDYWDFHVPYEAIEQSMDELEPSIYFLGHPNNPCGTLLEKDRMEGLLQLSYEKGHRLIIDESFIDFLGPVYSFREYISKYDHLMIVYSLTKFFSCPGIRLGAIISQQPWLDMVASKMPSWSVNRLAQIYGEEVLKETALIEESRKYVQKELASVYTFYLAHPYWKPTKPSVNYMLMEWIGPIEVLDKLHQRLLKDHILIRRCNTYTSLHSNWYRIAIKNKEDNLKLQAVMQDL